MNKKSGTSLRIKLIGMTMGITIVMGGVAFGLLNFIDHKIKDHQKSNFDVMAKNLGAAIEAQYYERYGDVQAFAINPQIQSRTKSEIVEALNNYAALYGIYDLILVVDAKGHLVAVNEKDPAGKPISAAKLYQKDFSNEPWFVSALKGEFSEDKENSFAGTFVENPQKDPYVTEVYGKDSYGNSFSTQIKDASGKVIGVVSNRAGSRWYDTEIKNYFQGAKEQGFARSEFLLTDSKGLIFVNYYPAANKGSLDVVNDDKHVLKSTYTEEGGAKFVIDGFAKGTDGVDIAETKNENGQLESSVVAFNSIRGPKMVKKMGWGVIIEEPGDEAFAQIHSIEKVFYSTLAIVMLLASLGAYFFSESLSKRLKHIAENLAAGAEDVNGASDKINSSSVSLSEASTEQAAAIQETAASIDEVSAMVKKNAENANHSREISQKSRQAAENGQAAVQDVIHAIEEISQSNGEIMSQVHESNTKIEDIVHLISEIGNKTKVINDIVFQTKLLSFNASVEAARAGEHGKGFAVVAEEVGNLAQMSGNAAKEISDMLGSSIQKVETIVRETKSKVEVLVETGKSKVELGTQTAKRCSEALESILTTVQEVDSVVSEIATASKEQSQGVSEINKAMNQLDQTTQTNATVAQSSASASNELKSQAGSLKEVVSELLWLISGTSDGGTVQHTTRASTRPTQSSGSMGHHQSHAEVIAIRPSKNSKKGNSTDAKSEPTDQDPRFEAI